MSEKKRERRPLFYIFTPLKYALIGLVGGTLLVVIILLAITGRSLSSTNSSPLGMEKDWARLGLYYYTVLGAIWSTIIGFVAGLIRVLVQLIRRE